MALELVPPVTPDMASPAPAEPVMIPQVLNRLYEIEAAARTMDGLLSGYQPMRMVVVAKDSLDATRKCVKVFQQLFPSQKIVAAELVQLTLLVTPDKALVVD
jgi:hypothetical protein